MPSHLRVPSPTSLTSRGKRLRRLLERYHRPEGLPMVGEGGVPYSVTKREWTSQPDVLYDVRAGHLGPHRPSGLQWVRDVEARREKSRLARRARRQQRLRNSR